MRAEYDSEADALSIDLVEVQQWERTESVDEDYCTVALANGRTVNVELVAPADHLDLLDDVAARYSLDGAALQAAARSALAVPDRTVLVDVASSA